MTKMTVEDMDRVDELHDRIDDLLAGEDFSVCLHAVCATVAGAGVSVGGMDGKSRASKQEFMASVHEAISSWYDYYQDIVNGGE